jgi:2,5-dihydroxypyridine 5,6-dioxygenase
MEAVMAISDVQLLHAWRDVLTLSNMKKGEAVTILSSSDTHQQNLNAARNAVIDLGGILTVLELPPTNGDLALSRDKTAFIGRTPLDGNKAAMAALKHSDLVIDLMLLLFSPEQAEVLKGGTRMLLAVEPPEVLTRLKPSLEDKRRVMAAASILRNAKTMKVTSSAGTMMECDLGDYPVLTEYGFVDEPGRWDHWPSGFLATWPNEQTARGTIVIDRGDILLPFKSYVQAPITLKIENGYISKIDGEFDADFLRSYMDSFHDREVYAISHIGWGLQPRAQWTALGLYDKEATLGMDARAFYGNFLFSTGPNTEAGGKRNTPCHIDIPLRTCSLSLDGVPMTINGKVVVAEQMAA